MTSLIFGPELLPRVLDHTKTVTRRRIKDGRAFHLRVGQLAAVKAQRTGPKLATIRILSVSTGLLSDAFGELYEEGFISAEEARTRSLYSNVTEIPIGLQERFAEQERRITSYWTALGQTWNPDEIVHRCEFTRVGDR